MQEYICQLVNGVLSQNNKEMTQLRNCNRTMKLPQVVRKAVDYRIQELESENDLIHEVFPHNVG